MQGREEIGLLDYARVLKKRRRTIVWFFVIAVLLTGSVTKLVLPQTFEATTTLIFPQPEPTTAPSVFLPTAEGDLQKMGALAGLGATQEPTDPYVAILKSRTIAERAVLKFGLQQRYNSDTVQEAVKKLQDDMNTEVTKEGLIKLTVAVTGIPLVVTWLGKANASEESRNGVDEAAEVAADIANYNIDQLSEFTQEEVFLHTATKYRVYVEEQLKKNREQLATADEALKTFKEKTHVVSLPDEVQGALQNITKVEADKIVTDARLKEVEARVKVITQQIVEETKAPLENVPAHSPFIQDLRNKLISQESELALLSQQYGPSYPDVVKKKMDIEETKKLLDDELHRVLSSVKSRLAPELIDWEQERISTAAKSAAQERVLEELKARGGSVPGKETELTRLQREVDLLSGIYTLLGQEAEKAKMTEAREVITYQVLDRAVPPVKKSRPSTLLNVALAAVLSLFLGAFWAFFKEYVENVKGGGRA